MDTKVDINVSTGKFFHAAKFTGFTISELLRENQEQEEVGGLG